MEDDLIWTDRSFTPLILRDNRWQRTCNRLTKCGRPDFVSLRTLGSQLKEKNYYANCAKFSYNQNMSEWVNPPRLREMNTTGIIDILST